MKSNAFFSLLEHIINVSQTDVSDKFPPNCFDIIYIPMDDEVRTNIKQVFMITYQLFSGITNLRKHRKHPTLYNRI